MGGVVHVSGGCVCEENTPDNWVSKHQEALGQEKQRILTLRIL